MTDTPLEERLRGLASIATKAPMIVALTDAANEIERLSKTRNEVIEECAAVISKHNKTGREWVPGSLWDSITLEAASRIRALSQEQSK